MKKIEDYALIRDELFYRGCHILDYIKAKSPLSSLDREAICATIMSALVERKLIDPKRDFFDFATLSITNDESDYHYDEHPFVQGFPLWMKEEFRKHILKITGSIPMSLSLNFPHGVSRCIYDMNTTVSYLFPEFTFYIANYDSPTREGVRAQERPFLEVEIGGVSYLVDTLTKRLFKSEEFKKRYNFEVIDAISKSEFDKERKQLYKEQTQVVTNLHGFASYINLSKMFLSALEGDIYLAEYMYEFAIAQERYQEAFAESEELEKQMDEFYQNLTGVKKRELKDK